MKISFIICLLCLSFNANAIDTFAVEMGGSINQTSGMSFSGKYRHYYNTNTTGLFTTGRISHWMESSNGDPKGTLINISGGYRLGSSLFVEGFFGPGFIIDPDGHELTGHFQLISGVGIGYIFKRITPFISYHHFSNGGIKEPNGGQDFIHLGIEWKFK